MFEWLLDPLRRRRLRAAMARGDHRLALVTAEGLLPRARGRERARLEVTRGLSQLQLGAFEDAADSLRRASELEPDEPWIRIHLAHASERAGRPYEALAAYAAALELAPDLGAAYHGQGNLLASLGRHEEALFPLRRALELATEGGRRLPAEGAPWIVPALRIFASCCRAIGRDDEVEALLNRFEKGGALGAEIADVERAIHYRKAGRHAAAEAIYLRLLAAEPEDPILRANLALLRVEAGRGEEDLGALRLRAEDGHAPSLFTLAFAYDRLGDVPAAMAHYERFLDQLAASEEKLGPVEGAERMVAEARAYLRRRRDEE